MFLNHEAVSGKNPTTRFFAPYRLPIDGPSGEPLYAEASVAGRKKEAVLECAQEACRMLDAAGLLRQSSHGKKKRIFKLPQHLHSVHAWNTCMSCHHFLTEDIFLLESRKHKEKNWEENDFYDSDEDSFLDRTGSGWCQNWFLTSVYACTTR